MSQQINLFNPVFLAKKKYFSALAMVQSLGLLLVGLILVHAFASTQAASLQRLLADTTRQAEQRRSQLLVLGKQYSSQGTSKTLEEDIAKVQAQLRKRTELLADIRTSVGGNAEGFAVFLTALARQSVPGVWLTGIDVGSKANQIVLKGRALRPELVPAYVAALSRERALAGRPLSSMEVRAREEAPRGPQPGGPVQRYVEFVLNIPLGEPAPVAAGGAS